MRRNNIILLLHMQPVRERTLRKIPVFRILRTSSKKLYIANYSDRTMNFTAKESFCTSIIDCSSLINLLTLLGFLVFTGNTPAQKLAAYTDYRDRFFIFDNGNHMKAEDLQVQSFAVGGDCILYINSQGHLKLYQDGVIVKLEVGGVSRYYATDYLAAYTIFDKLKVVENGQTVTLSMRCPLFQIEDSLIVFYDTNLESLRIYYGGEIEDIESGLVGMPISNLKSGDNIVAYISSRTSDFKIYYRGENHTILNYVGGLSFKAGKDLVAYINPLENSFNVYYKGQDYRVEDFPPESYRTGDNFVAYIDNQGAFKVFSKGLVQEVSSFPPDAYITEDNLLLFTESNYFKIFFNNQVFEVEGYIPRDFKMDWNTVAYVDNTNRIWLFSNGEKRYLINDLINTYEVYRDLIMMNVKVDRNIIYYNDQFFEGVSY